MLIIIRAKNVTANTRNDIGQYNMLTNKLQLWVNSSRLMNGEKTMIIPEFEEPDGIKKVEIIDEGTDQTLLVPVSVFNESKQVDNTHAFEFRDWLKKYRRLS